MAILTAADWQQMRGTSVTGADLSAAEFLCAAVDAALKRKLAPYYPEPVTISSRVLDAPWNGNVLYLPVTPVRSITSLYLRWGANGDTSLFTSDHLLTNYTDYYLHLDDPLNGWGHSGRVYRRGADIWGYERRHGYGRLAPGVDPNRGAVLATWAAGPTSVPDDIAQAAALAVTLLFNRRTDGAPYASESWNGRSQSLGGPFTASGALDTPDVLSLLAPYLTVRVA